MYQSDHSANGGAGHPSNSGISATGGAGEKMIKIDDVEVSPGIKINVRETFSTAAS